MAGGDRFRLILTDGSTSGSQQVRTVDGRPQDFAEVVQAAKANFKFEEWCAKRGFPTDGGEIRFQGMDGPRRVMLKDDYSVDRFFTTLKNTSLPTIEVRVLGDTSKTDLVDQRQRGRDARDPVEELEDTNFKLLRAMEKVDKRLAELERMNAENEEKNRRLMAIAQRQIEESQENVVREIHGMIDGLKADDANILKDLEVVRQHSFAVEKEDERHHQVILDQLDAFGQRVDGQFDDVNAEIDALKKEDARLDDEANETKENHQKQLDDHLAELQRLEETKVDEEKWEKAEATMAERITTELAAADQQVHDELTALEKKLDGVAADTLARFEEEISKRESEDSDIRQHEKETTERIDAAISKLQEDNEGALKEAVDELKADQKRMETDYNSKVSTLSSKTDQSFNATNSTLAKKDEAINKRVDELTAKSQATFEGIAERTEEGLKVERARFGAVERQITEVATKIRSDFRAEVERVRADYEQEAARLDSDLADLHMKNDVTKQEINFFQSRLKEQRDWTERQLTESATATRAAAVDSQEGLSASMKMLNALRDDAVSFREKMAKYISLLQHSSDSQGDAINALEKNRSRMRGELDALIGDHKAYTADMDGWSDDVRVKVERLFRALEPARVEWRVSRASQRAKELKKPLAVKSPNYSVKGIREGHMEFFPNGHNTAPDGKAVLRVFFPPTAHLRYQCWIGGVTDGPREQTPGNNLMSDIFMGKWEDEISSDGAVPVILEVLRDYSNDDASLARELRVESA